MYSWYLLKASLPAAYASHWNCTPVASRMRTTALVTSGPMPSPGISVITWVLLNLVGCALSGIPCLLSLISVLAASRSALLTANRFARAPLRALLLGGEQL